MRDHVTIGPRDANFILSEIDKLSCDTIILRNDTSEDQLVYPGEVLSEVEPGVYEKMAVTADTATSANGINRYQRVILAGKSLPVFILKRLTEVSTNRLIWPEGITAEQLAAASTELESQFVIQR